MDKTPFKPAMPLNVDEEASSAAGADYSRLMLDPLQRQIIEEVSAVIVRMTAMEVMPTRGFFWLAIKQWQKDRSLPVREMRKMTPEQRFTSACEIVRNFENIVAPLLPSDEQRAQLQQALEEALKYYMASYGSQSPDDS